METVGSNRSPTARAKNLPRTVSRHLRAEVLLVSVLVTACAGGRFAQIVTVGQDRELEQARVAVVALEGALDNPTYADYAHKLAYLLDKKGHQVVSAEAAEFLVLLDFGSREERAEFARRQADPPMTSDEQATLPRGVERVFVDTVYPIDRTRTSTSRSSTVQPKFAHYMSIAVWDGAAYREEKRADVIWMGVARLHDYAKNPDNPLELLDAMLVALLDHLGEPAVKKEVRLELADPAVVDLSTTRPVR